MKHDNFIWMKKRKKQIWVIDVDDMYKSNLYGMQLLYRYFFKANKTKTFYLSPDALELFGNLANLNMLPEQIISCWGISKVTIENDIR